MAAPVCQLLCTINKQAGRKAGNSCSKGTCMFGQFMGTAAYVHAETMSKWYIYLGYVLQVCFDVQQEGWHVYCCDCWLLADNCWGVKQEV